MRVSVTITAPGFARGAVVLCFALFVLGCRPPSYYAQRSGQGVVLREDRAADALVARARELELARSAAWLKLGHYRRDAYGGAYQSDADSPEFFLAPTGKYDPGAELEATIRAITAPGDPAKSDEHPACRFPARTFWLLRTLALDPRLLGVTSCPGFDKFMGEMRPAGVTLIFTSYYLNNPASAFGHTFLRVRKNDPYAIGKKRELLDYGIDFSADVTTNNPISYTVAGLTGLFHGTFKRVPYYYKVREYNDLESRDLWEYELDFSPEELTMLVAHVWELGRAYFDYFYLGENCSYAILGLVEAAKPELDLMRHITSPVIPAATVQALFTQAGFVREVKYRPSLRTQFEVRVADLTRAEQALVEALEKNADAALPIAPERAAMVLDAAADLIDIRHADELLKEREQTPVAQLKQRVLERRAALRVTSPDLNIDGDRQNAPESGHGARRIGLSLGRDAGDNLFVGTDFRLALHDLADASRGFPDGSQIEFFPVRLRFGEADGKFRVRVDQADIVRVVSLTPMRRFDHPISFQVNAGLRGVNDAQCRYCTAGHFLIGSGLSGGLWNDALIAYALVDAELFVGPPFRAGSDVPLRAGAGPSGGLRVRLHPDVILLGTGHYYYFPFQGPRAQWQADAVVRYQFVRDFAVSAEGRALKGGLEGQAFLLSYF